jgi:hypothetical protein
MINNTANDENGLQHHSLFVCNCCRLILFSEEIGHFCRKLKKAGERGSLPHEVGFFARSPLF